MVTGGFKISVEGVYRSPSSTPVEDGEMFLFLSLVAIPRTNFSYYGNLPAPRVSGICDSPGVQF